LVSQGRRIINTEQDVAQLKTALEQQREYIQTVANIYTQQKAQLAELKLSDAELLKRTLTTAAEQAGIPVTELESAIQLFVAAVRANPGADFMDRALADFAEQNFAAAAENAGHAADEAHTRRLAAEKLAAHAIDKVTSAQKDERQARNLQGQSFYAEKHYTHAAQAFEQALEVTSQSEHSQAWAELQARLGMAFDDLARVSMGDDITEYRQQAIAAYQDALQVRTREALPQYWAMTQNNLASALRNQAIAAEGDARAQLLTEAIAARKLALEVITAENYPQWHAEQIAWIQSAYSTESCHPNHVIVAT
jgi:tetratricopeptide (TPR) repeat protein